MAVDTINISSLTAGERVELMERLRRSLAADLEKEGPPAWHDDQLASRKGEWEQRETVAEDWPRVRERLSGGSSGVVSMESISGPTSQCRWSPMSKV